MYFDSLETYFIRFVISISNYNQIDFIEKKCGQKKKKLYPDKCIFRYCYLLTFRCVFNVDFQQMLPGYFTL